MHGFHHSIIAQFKAHHLSSARIVAVLLLTLWGASITGCGGGNSNTTTDPNPNPTPTPPPSSSGMSVLTYHNDNARTAQNLSETALTPTNVASSTFGKIGFYSVDGKVDGEPLYVSGMSLPGKGTHNVLIAASEHDTVYAFDADTGSTLWSTTLLKSGETTSDARSCDQVEPEIGVTSTPVIDPKAGPNGAVYVVAMSKNGATYHQRLHALDLASGAELFNGPIEVQAKFPGTGDNSDGTNVIFDPAQYKERVALLLLNGIVYTSWASHCDIQPYTGWIIAYNGSTLAQTSVLNITPNGNEGAIWMSGGALAADDSGNIYLLDGNGTFDTTLDANGFPSKGDFGNAFLKLSTTGNQLAVADYFEMYNQAAENSSDGDLGSGSPMLIPDLKDASGNTKHLAVGAGKDANLYVVDRDAMGKFDPSRNNIYQEITGAFSGEVFSAPAFFNGTVYMGSVGGPLQAFTTGGAHLTAAAKTSNSFAYPGASPSISANGTSNAIVWAVENTTPAILHAYDPVSLKELYNSNQASGGRDQFGDGNKFITPMIANGRVFVGTTNGVAVFGLLH
jgi:outer membrane protein assembly factor BamB